MIRNHSGGCFRVFTIVSSAVLFVLLAGVGLAGEPEKPAWRYVVPSVGDPMEHPPLRELTLSDMKPPDLKESVHYRGGKQRYGEFHFGPAGSKLVAVVLDSDAAGRADVYVDVNRNREIEAAERLDGPGPKYRAALSMDIPRGGQVQRILRTVVVRLGRGGWLISYATAGYMEGTVRLEGRAIPVRRVDANGDGGMADPVDLLWVNRRADGRWNPFIDRLPMTPIIQFENLRYAVRSDWAGEQLVLEKLEGAGELELSLPVGMKKEDFLSLDLLLVGREGLIARLDLTQNKVTVPVGKYSLYELSMVMKDRTGSEPWGFYFGRNDDAPGAASHGYAVKANGRTPVQPLTALTLAAKLDKNDLRYRPGQVISVQPRIQSADPLSLRACYRSDRQDSSKRHAGAEIRLTTYNGRALDSALSGFS